MLLYGFYLDNIIAQTHQRRANRRAVEQQQQQQQQQYQLRHGNKC